MEVQSLEELANGLEDFRLTDEMKFKWMETLLIKYKTLTQDYIDLSRDFKREQVAGRITQGEVEEWKHKYEGLHRSLEQNSFVLGLIDADADTYMFKEEYYSKGNAGGRKAARDLKASIQTYLGMKDPKLSGLPIHVKAFANADGLSRVLVKAKIIKSPSVLWEFAQGFSQACETFDFVLVGNGKDRADEKIKGIFDQFVRNPTCCHIIFGACHDNGYVRLLEKYDEDQTVMERVTLLHSFQVGKEYQSLGFQSTNMDTVFRSERLGARKSPLLAKSNIFPQRQNGNAIKQPTISPAVEADTDNDFLPVSRKDKSLPAGTILVNASNQRVDSTLPHPSRTALESWNSNVKKAGMRYCYMYHLYGDCNGLCGYYHGPMSEGEKLVHRVYLRKDPCHVGVGCRNPKCFYGHNCSCTKQSCRFSAGMHAVDVSSARIWKKS